MTDLKSLRNSRNDTFSKIATAFEKTSNGNKFVDERFWKPERDKAGNAGATIRFLTRTEGDELPWVKIFNHGFKHQTGRWFIDNCPTTLGKDCPVNS
jgi:hypothetical protein